MNSNWTASTVDLPSRCHGYQIGRVLGEGTFGRVYEVQTSKSRQPRGPYGTRISPGTRLAMKRIPLQDTEQDGLPDDLLMELQTLATLTDHPNLVSLLDVFFACDDIPAEETIAEDEGDQEELGERYPSPSEQSGQPSALSPLAAAARRARRINSPPAAIYIVMPYASGGDLSAWIESVGGKLDLDRVRDFGNWLRQVLRGIQHLHGKQLAHLDIKPANILLYGQEGRESGAARGRSRGGHGGGRRGGRRKNPSREPRVTTASSLTAKLSDYGLAGWARSRALPQGSPAFMAPELLQLPRSSAPHSAARYRYDLRRADIWSIGALIANFFLGGGFLEWQDFLGPGGVDWSRLEETTHLPGPDSPASSEAMSLATETNQAVLAGMLRSLWEMAKSCMRVVPASRPTVSALLVHDFFARLDAVETCSPAQQVASWERQWLAGGPAERPRGGKMMGRGPRRPAAMGRDIGAADMVAGGPVVAGPGLFWTILDLAGRARLLRPTHPVLMEAGPAGREAGTAGEGSGEDLGMLGDLLSPSALSPPGVSPLLGPPPSVPGSPGVTLPIVAMALWIGIRYLMRKGAPALDDVEDVGMVQPGRAGARAQRARKARPRPAEEDESPQADPEVEVLSPVNSEAFRAALRGAARRLPGRLLSPAGARALAVPARIRVGLACLDLAYKQLRRAPLPLATEALGPGVLQATEIDVLETVDFRVFVGTDWYLRVTDLRLLQRVWCEA